MTTPEPCGLIIAEDARAVPLTGVEVSARVVGTLSRVTVTQRYENREDVPVEALYVFPLEERSAVCGFAVTIGDRRIDGRVLPRDEAFDAYDDAMAEGHGAYLLDQERPNVFTASVGNVPPGQSVSVEIAYVTELEATRDGVRLMIPTTVSPRYLPEHRRDFDGLTGAERVSPPLAADVPYRLIVDVEADLLSPIRAVESPSHKIAVELDGARARIRLAGDEGALDRDLVLTLRAAEPHRPGALLARDAEGDRFALVSFTPEVPAERVPLELTFLVDCSGSMQGTSIEEARRTLLLCLGSLLPGDRFDIVRFGSRHEALFGEPVPYDDTSLARARAAVERMDADLGGTEVLRPLAEILERDRSAARPHRVVLLTDGQVVNEDEVIALARRHRERTRIFAFGIGAGVSEHLVRGVSRASRGAAELVHPGEAIEDKVMRHFDRITLSAATDLEVAWEGIEVTDVTPAEVPALAPGEPVSFVARVTAGTAGRAVLSGRVPGGEVRMEAAIDEAPPDAEADAVVPTLWARRRIREIEEGTETPRGSRQESRRRKRTEAELVRLGTRYGLLSSATSYVVVEEREESDRAGTRAELRRIPVALTRGWGGGSMLYSAGIGKTSVLGARMFRASAPGSTTRAFAEDSVLGDVAGEAAPLRAHARGPRRRDPETDLLTGQNADGSWNLDETLARCTGADLDSLRGESRRLEVRHANRILATLVVLVWLEDRPGGVPPTWAPVVRKAEAWLASTLGEARPPAGDDWKEWARSLA